MPPSNRRRTFEVSAEELQSIAELCARGLNESRIARATFHEVHGMLVSIMQQHDEATRLAADLQQLVLREQDMDDLLESEKARRGPAYLAGSSRSGNRNRDHGARRASSPMRNFHQGLTSAFDGFFGDASGNSDNDPTRVNHGGRHLSLEGGHPGGMPAMIRHRRPSKRGRHHY